ncbi:hypothetical protein A2U01_0029766, partial [Trifolium medium]|nr:hypothetical protein [Trifolium medium]
GEDLRRRGLKSPVKKKSEEDE